MLKIVQMLGLERNATEPDDIFLSIVMLVIVSIFALFGVIDYYYKKNHFSTNIHFLQFYACLFLNPDELFIVHYKKFSQRLRNKALRETAIIGVNKQLKILR